MIKLEGLVEKPIKSTVKSVVDDADNFKYEDIKTLFTKSDGLITLSQSITNAVLQNIVNSIFGDKSVEDYTKLEGKEKESSSLTTDFTSGIIESGKLYNLLQYSLDLEIRSASASANMDNEIYDENIYLEVDTLRKTILKKIVEANVLLKKQLVNSIISSEKVLNHNFIFMYNNIGVQSPSLTIKKGTEKIGVIPDNLPFKLVEGNSKLLSLEDYTFQSSGKDINEGQIITGFKYTENKPIKIMNISNATQGIITLENSVPENITADPTLPEIYIIDVEGMTQVNSKKYTITAIKDSDVNYQLKDFETGELNINTSDFSKFSYSLKFQKYCCRIDLDDSNYNLDTIKNNACRELGEQYKTGNNEENKQDLKVNIEGLDSENKCPEKSCVRLDNEVLSECRKMPPINYGINTLKIKLRNLKVELDEDIENIERLSEGNTTSFEVYKSKHTFTEQDSIIKDKHDLIFFILSKQIKRALRQERNKVFTTGFEDKCHLYDEINCTEQPLCYLDRSAKKETCEKETKRVPFPEFCTPKYMVPDRNICPYDADLHNRTLRGLLHDKLTKINFSGKWSSAGGIIEIEEKFNDYCQFEFTTPVDKKEFKMIMVHNSGVELALKADTEQKDGKAVINKVSIEEYQPKKNGNLHAKGTFIDPELRKIEERDNLPKLEYHGFAEMKMTSEKGPTTGSNSCEKIPKLDRFIGVWKYLDEITKDKDNKYSKYTEKETYLMNYYEDDKPKTKSGTKEEYCYRMMEPSCNEDLESLFGFHKDPEVDFSKVEKTYFDKGNLPDIDPSFLPQ